jgi:osmotically-inducible protein OsmY
MTVLVAGGLLAAAPAQAQEVPRMTDQEISDAIEDELIFDPAVEVNKIDIATIDGVVQLTGSVSNIMAKQRAASIAETVKGVRVVDNRIDVIPLAFRTDRDIRKDAQTALLMDRATESFEVDVSVTDNVVTLTGTVDSWQEKQLAEKVVKGVKGVVGVNNEINVDYATERADTEIKAEIEKRLRWDALVDGALVEVNVEDGKVNLDGTVGSAAEKSQARADAWVAGVTEVNADDLTVEGWARDPEMRKDKYVVKSDEAVEDAIQDGFLYNPRVMSYKLEADADDGIVTLRGNVDTVKARRVAARIARNTVGVIDVINRVRVRPSTPTDEAIEENIREALRANPYVEKYEVDVEVEDGVAYLNGTVDSYFEKGEADDVVSTIYGVASVRNKLEVDYDYDPLVYDPYLGDDYLYDYDWYDYQPDYTYMSDAELQAEVADELWWSPYVDRDEVEVDAEEGAVTLEGTVETWSERAHATEEAYEAGATWVYNNIEVE